MSLKKIFIITVSAFTLVGSGALVAYSSKNNLDYVQENFKNLREEMLNEYKADFKYSKILDRELINYGFKENGKAKVNKETEYSFLGQETSKYIKVYDYWDEKAGYFGARRVYLYEKDKIENIIYNFFDKELNDSYFKQYNYYNFENETSFVNKYLSLSSIHPTNEFENKLSNLYLNKISYANNEELNYLSDYAYNQYEGEIASEKNTDYFVQTINGWDLVGGFMEAFKIYLVAFVIVSIITAAIASLIATSAGTGMVGLIPLKAAIVKALTSSGIVVSGIETSIIASIIAILIKYPIRQNFNAKLIIQMIQNKEINSILESNKKALLEGYGEDVWKKYEEYFKKGFNNGLGGKFGSWFGSVSVKDRAVLISDQTKNPLWDLKSAPSNSTAKFREWLPWMTYTKKKNYDHYFNRTQKLTFFTATLATKFTWTGTYYGDINSPMANSYQLDKSGNWLEKTTLNLMPYYLKKTKSTSKSMYISENLKNTRYYATMYKDNKNDFSSSLDYKTKNTLQNYPTLNQYNNSKFASFGIIFK
ncbi:hypothetical protein MENTO_v1c00620 [Mesoplasma entomophilum]|uniref:Uncharacterized protein n=1 Tax=Mesoplasma entomophilum TaxID=2149 RepID=A0A3S5XYB6_9MOLU|nr:hypothetical protein [Mesoplasma entomophilum]ATQ35223.1 hypothetical protein CS528_00310 [Mesoplasma entomophilum]ATZ19171.1 hypothetical protein MENTO_v1c00620 [Mesoplasma entomophilum]